MLNVEQLSKQIADLVAGSISVSDFQRWFRWESRNVHLWGDISVKDAVFSVESVFSEYHFAGLDDDGLKQELDSAIRPFCLSSASVLKIDPSDYWAWTSSGSTGSVGGARAVLETAA